MQMQILVRFFRRQALWFPSERFIAASVKLFNSMITEQSS